MAVSESTELCRLLEHIERVVDDEPALLELRATARMGRGLSDVESAAIDGRIGRYLADLDRSRGAAGTHSSPTAG
jgi:hypothetical protein